MENRREKIYNVRLVARLTGTVLYIDRVAVPANLVEIIDIANIGQRLKFLRTPAVETAGWQIAVGGVCKVLRSGPVTNIKLNRLDIIILYKNQKRT